MNDIFTNIIKSLQNFDQQSFMSSLATILFVVYITLSFFFAFKAFNDSRKRINDKILVVAFTVFIFIFHLFGLGYILYSIIRPKDLIQDQHMLKLEKYFLEYETQGIGKCKVCKHIYFPEHSYCVNCGSVVRTKCSVCDNTIELDWHVCPYCGDKKQIELKNITIKHKAIKTSIEPLDKVLTTNNTDSAIEHTETITASIV